MFHIKSTFEKLLRNNDDSSTKIEHRKCRGLSHGKGNYTKTGQEENENGLNLSRSSSRRSSSGRLPLKCSDDSALCNKKKTGNFQRNFSSFNEKSKSGRIMVESFRNRKTKPSSISSGDFSGCSSTDSVDTISKSNDFDEKTNKLKIPDICERLYSQSTKASQAKTAQQRYQDVLNDDEMWIEYLGNEATKNEKIIKRLLANGKIKRSDENLNQNQLTNGFHSTNPKKLDHENNETNVELQDEGNRIKREEEKKRKQRRRENLKRVLDDKIEIKSTVNPNQETPLLTRKKSMKRTPPPIPPKPKNIEFLKAIKIQRPFNKPVTKGKDNKTLTIEEARWIARNRKSLVFGSDNILFKDIKELLNNAAIDPNEKVS